MKKFFKNLFKKNTDRPEVMRMIDPDYRFSKESIPYRLNSFTGHCVKCSSRFNIDIEYFDSHTEYENKCLTLSHEFLGGGVCWCGEKQRISLIVVELPDNKMGEITIHSEGVEFGYYTIQRIKYFLGHDLSSFGLNG